MAVASLAFSKSLSNITIGGPVSGAIMDGARNEGLRLDQRAPGIGISLTLGADYKPAQP